MFTHIIIELIQISEKYQFCKENVSIHRQLTWTIEVNQRCRITIVLANLFRSENDHLR